MRPIDVQVSLAVIALIGPVTRLASYLPAWRAAIVHPVEVLKTE